MVENNKVFDKVYSNIVSIILNKLNQIKALNQAGFITNNITVIKRLNLYITYLHSVKTSKYRYLHVSSLTEINNYLNTI